jgi:hypothetical protein
VKPFRERLLRQAGSLAPLAMEAAQAQLELDER